MIAPLIPVAIKGAIWYQGESNAGRAHQYRSLFADMIKNWRQDWDNDFTFLLVQLAPFKKIETQPGDSDWAELREAQLLATQKLPKVGMAVITDVGEENDIHPKKKAPVGARLALAARSIAYGEKIEYSGPVFRSLKIKGHEAVVSFSHVGRGLEARGGELRGFAICGDDRKWVWGKAEIRGSTVVVTSPEVAKPVAVRYGWANYPVVNLWNKDGLPATPFRTDNFPMITAPRPVAKK
jgi:sialate O-acetylesterase